MSIPENVKYYLDRGYSIIQEREYPEKTDRWYVMRKRLMKHDERFGFAKAENAFVSKRQIN